MLKRLSPNASKDTAKPAEAPVTNAMVKHLYERPPSFTDLLPWVEYNRSSRTFLLEDGISLGALFELTPAGTEARTPEFMTQLRDAIQTALTAAIPEEDDAPWVLQVYVQDEPSLQGFQKEIAGYAQPSAKKTQFTRHFQAMFAQHLARITRPGGLFEDRAVTGTHWRGQVRRVRATLYRRLKPKGRQPSAIEVEEALNDVAIKWVASLASAGIRARRGTGQDLYEWLLKWFNPAPEIADGDPDKLLEIAPHPGDEDLPFGYDLAERLTLTMPRSDKASATWWFDDLPHTIVTVHGLRRAPEVGHMTAERQAGDHIFSLFDRLPEQTVMVMTLTVKPQDFTRNHITQGEPRPFVQWTKEARRTTGHGRSWASMPSRHWYISIRQMAGLGPNKNIGVAPGMAGTASIIPPGAEMQKRSSRRWREETSSIRCAWPSMSEETI